LNDLAPFDSINPSAENLAKFFHEQASRQIPRTPNAPRITQITVWETDDTSATYTP
jgi:6-pyruvoyltetrahydropterin/6-carboxytetrahydropterin synthase